MNDLLKHIGQQHAFFDLLVKSWSGEYAGSGGTLHCGKGCSGCCNLVVNATFPEAAALSDAVTEEQATAAREYVAKLSRKMADVSDLPGYLRMHRRDMICPFLDPAGSCGVYGSRPLSCRALLSTRESRWCSTDFTTLSVPEKQEYLAGNDRAVAAFPLHYVATTQEAGQELEAATNRRMRERFGFSLYGNLPVLLVLARDHHLHETCAAGLEETLRLLAAAGLGHPLLVTMDR